METADTKSTSFALSGASVAALCVFSAMLLIAALYRPVQYAYEDFVFAHDHTAARAYQFGSKHFDANFTNEYDIRRASYFFEQALMIDPDYPMLQFQVARIDFLYGNQASALAHIDRAIEKYGDEVPNTYYVRGLINGFMGDYKASAADYEAYFTKAPANWAGINDYAWALMKEQAPELALDALNWGLDQWPENPWLLNNKVIALYELGRYEEAKVTADAAMRYVGDVREMDWLHSYPGNDPALAKEGLAGFKRAVAENRAKVELALASSTRNK